MSSALLDPLTASWQSLRLAEAIRTLGLGATIVARSEPGHWYRLVDDPQRFTVLELELHLGLELGRSEYNRECLSTVRQTKRTHRGRRAGFNDLWIPILDRGDVGAVLAFGPFLTEAPTLESLQDSWQTLVNRAASPKDDAFLRYVECAIDAHVYTATALTALTRFLERVASVMAGIGPARPYAKQLADWRALLRYVPETRMWQIASDLTDPQRHVAWTAGLRSKDILEEGLLHMPDHVIVAIPSARDSDAPTSAVEMLRVNRLQRACARFASEIGDAVAGRLGRGAAFVLVYPSVRRASNARAKLLSLAERLGRFVRRELGLEVACGVSRRARTGDELPECHDQALRAALWGLHSRRAVTFYDEAAGSHEAFAPVALYRGGRTLREAFARANAREVSVSAEQLIKSVLWVSGGNPEVMRSHFLELIWDLVAISERRSGIDETAASETLSLASAALDGARSAAQVTSAFKSAVHELLERGNDPAAHLRKAKLEKARRLVNSAAPDDRIDLETIAQRIGLSLGHFARSFRETYGTSFGRYVLGVRLKRSHAMLRETRLPVREVARESGFSSASYFVQAFKRATGLTPTEYRKGARGSLDGSRAGNSSPGP